MFLGMLISDILSLVKKFSKILAVFIFIMTCLIVYYNIDNSCDNIVRKFAVGDVVIHKVDAALPYPETNVWIVTDTECFRDFDYVLRKKYSMLHVDEVEIELYEESRYK